MSTHLGCGPPGRHPERGIGRTRGLSDFGSPGPTSPNVRSVNSGWQRVIGAFRRLRQPGSAPDRRSFQAAGQTRRRSSAHGTRSGGTSGGGDPSSGRATPARCRAPPDHDLNADPKVKGRPQVAELHPGPNRHGSLPKRQLQPRLGQYARQDRPRLSGAVAEAQLGPDAEPRPNNAGQPEYDPATNDRQQRQLRRFHRLARVIPCWRAEPKPCQHLDTHNPGRKGADVHGEAAVRRHERRVRDQLEEPPHAQAEPGPHRRNLRPRGFQAPQPTPCFGDQTGVGSAVPRVGDEGPEVVARPPVLGWRPNNLGSSAWLLDRETAPECGVEQPISSRRLS